MKSHHKPSQVGTALPPGDPHRLSLANPVVLAMAPRTAQPMLAAIAMLDDAMATIVARARGGEAMLAQLKLAWWRDEIAALGEDRARPDPGLATLADAGDALDRAYLAEIVDAWEAMLLGDHKDADAVAAASRLRGGAVYALAHGAVGEQYGSSEQDDGLAWALTDYTATIADEAIRRDLFARVAVLAPTAWTLRPLAALDGWARRIARRQGARAPLRDQAWLVRVGLFGG